MKAIAQKISQLRSKPAPVAPPDAKLSAAAAADNQRAFSDWMKDAVQFGEDPETGDAQTKVDVCKAFAQMMGQAGRPVVHVNYGGPLPIVSKVQIKRDALAITTTAETDVELVALHDRLFKVMQQLEDAKTGDRKGADEYVLGLQKDREDLLKEIIAAAYTDELAERHTAVMGGLQEMGLAD